MIHFFDIFFDPKTGVFAGIVALSALFVERLSRKSKSLSFSNKIKEVSVVIIVVFVAVFTRRFILGGSLADAIDDGILELATGLAPILVLFVYENRKILVLWFFGIASAVVKMLISLLSVFFVVIKVALPYVVSILFVVSLLYGIVNIPFSGIFRSFYGMFVHSETPGTSIAVTSTTPIPKLTPTLKPTSFVDTNPSLENNSSADVFVKSISVGDAHICVILRNGDVKCWGSNDKGQSNVPTNLGQVRQISAGEYHTCAITMDNLLRCWGGYGDWKEADVPSDLGSVRQVSAGRQATCVVTTDDRARCWGNRYAYLPDIPTDLGTVQQISVNAFSSPDGLLSGTACAVTTEGKVRCWGNNLYLRNETQPADLDVVNQVIIGADLACAVEITGKGRCWGYEFPSIPTDLGSISQVSVGTDHICAITSAGNVKCWGDNSYGQSSVPSDLDQVVEIGTGDRRTCAVTKAGSVKCWGKN